MAQYDPSATREHETEHDFLAGGGELGAAMRALDWSQTHLGPPEGWPQSLKTAVSILLNSRYPMFVFWGPKLVKLYNDAYRPITGSKHPWALGRPGPEVWPEIWDTIGPMVERVVNAGEATWSDDLLLFMHRNGFAEEVYFTFSYSPIRDESGGIGGMFCACTETTRKVLGERRLRTLRDLAAAPAEARSVEAACRLSAEVLACNAADVPFALVYMLDGETARLVGSAGVASVEVTKAAIPNEILLDSSQTLPFGRVAATGLAERVCDLPRRLKRVPAGPWPDPPQEALVLPLHDRGFERPLGFLLLGISARLSFDEAYRDFFELIAKQITGSMQNARALEEERRRVEALAELDRAKTAFFSNVSHELRTPLTLMLGPLADALEDASAPVPDRQRERLERAHRNGLRLQKVVNTLLEFSRIEAGRLEASYEPVDLSLPVQELASAFRSLFESAGVELHVDAPALPEPVYVDREMFDKIVSNLLSNAFKFTLQGSVHVSLRHESGRVVLTVRDSGIGIPAEHLSRVFERFHRVPDAKGRSFDGTGIGLALVRELVKMHGGEISAESQVGLGTTMRVVLPTGRGHLDPTRIVDSELPAVSKTVAESFTREASQWLGLDTMALPQPSPTHGGATLPEVTRGMRVLVVDDNADMRDYLRRILAEQELTVETACDGAHAMRVVQASLPDLIVSDVMMPHLDGFGLLRAIRSDPATQHVPVLLLSARAGEESRVEGLRAGSNDYLVKPFSAHELVARVGAQLELARLRSALQLERDQLVHLFANAPTFICVLSGPEHVYEFANPKYLELVGERELIGHSVRQALPEVMNQGFLELLDGVYETGEAYVGKEVPLKVARPDGSEVERHVTFVCQPRRDANGAVDGIYVFGSDESEAVTTRKKLEAANRSKDEFLAMLGHELRNPLAPMRLIFDAARLRGSVTLGERHFHMLDRQTAALGRMVDDLLDVARITRGTVELRPEAVELAPLVMRSVDSVRSLLERRQHELTVELAKELLSVQADPVRLEQVIVNLLSNAAKYTNPGGHIALCVEPRGDRIELRVRDDGIGLDEDRLESIFNPFEQAGRRLDRPEGGLGIGLTIVKRLVELHGGTVTAKSPGRGQGSEFVVELPRREVPRTEPGADLDPKRPGVLADDALRVLIVDDNEDAAQVLAETVAVLSHETRVAHDGPSALAMVSEFAPDLVLLDIGMPGMDGYELAPKLRAIVGAKPVLVAVTGYGQPSDRQRSFEAGFAYHLVKPVQMAALESVLSTIQPVWKSEMGLIG